MVELIPSQDTLMQILKRTGAFREGHFIYPNGKHSPHYFQMPLAFRYYDTARVLAVALSRKFRLEKDISSQLPKVSVISPSSGGIPVAFGVRDALNAHLRPLPVAVLVGAVFAGRLILLTWRGRHSRREVVQSNRALAEAVRKLP